MAVPTQNPFILKKDVRLEHLGEDAWSGSYSINAPATLTPEWVACALGFLTRLVSELPDARPRNVRLPEGHDHELEDALREEVLRSISDGRCSDPQTCAALAMKTEELDIDHMYSY